MYHLRVPVFLLTALVLLRCIAAAPSNRYFSPSSSDDDEQENALVIKERRSLPELISDPFLGLRGPRPERQLTATNSQHLQKRLCNTSLCGTQKLSDKMAHLGKKGQKTDVGPYSFGKRDTHQLPNQLPF